MYLVPEHRVSTSELNLSWPKPGLSNFLTKLGLVWDSYSSETSNGITCYGTMQEQVSCTKSLCLVFSFLFYWQTKSLHPRHALHYRVRHKARNQTSSVKTITTKLGKVDWQWRSRQLSRGLCWPRPPDQARRYAYKIRKSSPLTVARSSAHFPERHSSPTIRLPPSDPVRRITGLLHPKIITILSPLLACGCVHPK